MGPTTSAASIASMRPARSRGRRSVRATASVPMKPRKRTLTNNARPQWLSDAHAALDAAVAAAYGWPAEITDDEALRELLDLNGGRQAEEAVRHDRH